MTTALVLVDLMPRIVQQPFTPYTGDEVLTRCRTLAEAFRAAGRPVIQIRTDRPDVTEQPPGSDFVEGLVHPGDIVLVKQAFGAFGTTDIDQVLRDNGIETLVFAGLVTNYGVESTARAASDFGYGVEFVSDAMSGMAEGDHEFALTKVFSKLGDVFVTSDYLGPA